MDALYVGCISCLPPISAVKGIRSRSSSRLWAPWAWASARVFPARGGSDPGMASPIGESPSSGELDRARWQFFATLGASPGTSLDANPQDVSPETTSGFISRRTSPLAGDEMTIVLTGSLSPFLAIDPDLSLPQPLFLVRQHLRQHRDVRLCARDKKLTEPDRAVRSVYPGVLTRDVIAKYLGVHCALPYNLAGRDKGRKGGGGAEPAPEHVPQEMGCGFVS